MVPLSCHCESGFLCHSTAFYSTMYESVSPRLLYRFILHLARVVPFFSSVEDGTAEHQPER